MAERVCLELTLETVGTGLTRDVSWQSVLIWSLTEQTKCYPNANPNSNTYY